MKRSQTPSPTAHPWILRGTLSELRGVCLALALGLLGCRSDALYQSYCDPTQIHAAEIALSEWTDQLPALDRWTAPHRGRALASQRRTLGSLYWTDGDWDQLHDYSRQQLEATQHLWSELRVSSRWRAQASTLSNLADDWVALMDASEKQDENRAVALLMRLDRTTREAVTRFCVAANP